MKTNQIFIAVSNHRALQQRNERVATGCCPMC